MTLPQACIFYVDVFSPNRIFDLGSKEDISIENAWNFTLISNITRPITEYIIVNRIDRIVPIW